MIDWELLSYMASVFLAMGTTFYYTILKPLSDSIDALRDSAEEMRSAIKESNADRRLLDSRVGRVEESTKSAHKRLDHMEERLNNERR